MPYCESCGTFGEGAFCASCGRKLEMPRTSSMPTTVQPSPTTGGPQMRTMSSSPSVQAPSGQYPPPIALPQTPQATARPGGLPLPPQMWSAPAMPSQPISPSAASPQVPIQKKGSRARTAAIAAVVVVALILVVVVMLYVVLPRTGVNVTTGALQVRYNSSYYDEVKLYIDGDYRGTFPSSEFHTFNGISPGTHEVEFRNIEDGRLDMRTVQVKAGGTTTIELPEFA